MTRLQISNWQSIFASKNDKDGIKEIVEGFISDDEAVANDCIKVLFKDVSRFIMTENLIVTAIGSIVGVMVGFAMQYGVIHAAGSEEMDLRI